MAIINMEVTPDTARKILRDLYAPCIDSLESWNPCVQYEGIDSLSDDECISFMRYVLAGFTLTVSCDENDVWHPVIRD